MSFDDEEARPHQSSRFVGEDKAATTSQELNGWYSYAIAAEVFAVVGVGSFLPVTLEQLARERGVFYSDRSTPCVVTAADSTKFQVRHDAGSRPEGQCVVNYLGAEMTTASFAMYTFSAAVLVQAITLICFSSFADHGPYRKKMLLIFAYTGSTASALFILISPSVYFLAPLLVIVGVTCLGCSFTLLNAFLPLLVTHHDGNSKLEDPSSDFELEALNPESTTTRHFDSDALSRDLERSAQLSSKGVGLGYIAAVLFQCISIAILFLFSRTSIRKSSPSFPMRVILFLVGIWWATFTLPTLLWLRPRPGPPLPSQSHAKHRQPRYLSFFFYLQFSLASFWNTLKRAMRLRQVILCLVAWFLLSDAIATVSGTAVLFARTELEMGTIAIALLSITSISFGVVGAFSWPRIAKRFSLTPKGVLICCVVSMEIVPLYGLLGYIPFIQRAGVGGLQKPWEIYPLGALHGIIMGGISSYARSVYAPLIPEGSEAAFFALFAVTDKGSSAVGPALVGFIVDRMGTIRPAFVFLAILALLPTPLLWRLDVERGREDAARMADVENKRAGDMSGSDHLYAGDRSDSFEISED